MNFVLFCYCPKCEAYYTQHSAAYIRAKRWYTTKLAINRILTRIYPRYTVYHRYGDLYVYDRKIGESNSSDNHELQYAQLKAMNGERFGWLGEIVHPDAAVSQTQDRICKECLKKETV